MNQERDRYIFETLNPGKCWHVLLMSPMSNDDGWYTSGCQTCNAEFDNPDKPDMASNHRNPDLSTAEGFQEVWGWMRKDIDLWDRFTYFIITKYLTGIRDADFLDACDYIWTLIDSLVLYCF